MKDTPILDEVARKITASRRLMPILYLVSEDRDVLFDLLRRGDCFDVQRQNEDGSITACAYAPPLETLNVIPVTRPSDFQEEQRIGKRPVFKGPVRCYYLRDFAALEEHVQREYIIKYIEHLDGGGPLLENLVIVSPTAPHHCIPPGFEQFVEVINVPLIGMWEIAALAAAEQSRLLALLGRPPLSPEALLAEPEPYLEKCRGLHAQEVRYVLRQLAERFGWVARAGLSTLERLELRQTDYFHRLEKAAEKMIYERKQQMVAKDGAIDFLPTGSMEKPSGMEGLCDWILQKRKILDDEENARRRAEKFPKGVLIAGLPGSGKSMAAKYIAHALHDIPLIHFKLGYVLTGVIGGTEERLERALKLIEAVSPCVVWIDEIEKELSGAQGKGDVDAGVASRCLATLLSWMQENRSRCFVCATANHIETLPYELLRRGRFDRKYYTFLPLQAQCEEILAAHLAQSAKEAPELFDRDVQNRFAELSRAVFDEIGSLERKFFTGADIEGLVQDAKSLLFQRDEPLPYSWDVMKGALVQTARVSQPYGETNFGEVLDYWIALRDNPFLNAAVPEAFQDTPRRREYLLFDFSDFVYDGKSWHWELKDGCASPRAYDQKLFRALKDGIERRKNNTTHLKK